MGKPIVERFLGNLRGFFEKYPELQIKRYVCYFLLGMLKMRGREELMGNAMTMVLEIGRGFEGISEKINKERRVEFFLEIRQLTQDALCFVMMSEEQAKEIEVYCQGLVFAEQESLEAYLEVKLPAKDFYKDFFKTVLEPRFCPNAVVATVRSLYAERFSLISEKELSKSEVIEMIKFFYVNKGYQTIDGGNQFLVFEDNKLRITVTFSVYDKIVLVTVNNEPSRTNVF